MAEQNLLNNTPQELSPRPQVPEAPAEPTLETQAPPQEAAIEVEQTKERERPTQEQEQAATAAQVEGTMRKLKRPKKGAKTIPQVRDQMTLNIEHVLEEGLGDAYQQLTPVQKQEFKIKGEQTAIKIRQLLKSTHVRVKKIFKLIVEWLKILPGVNKFFLEQEAKIKADKIIALRHFNDKS